MDMIRLLLQQNGIMFAYLVIGYLLYRPVTQQQDDEMAQFIEEKNGQFTELEIETIQGYYSQSLPLFFVIGIRDGQDFDAECAIMTGESEPFSAIVTSCSSRRRSCMSPRSFPSRLLYQHFGREKSIFRALFGFFRQRRVFSC